MDDLPGDERARNHWLAIQATRASGVIGVVIGLLIADGAVPGPVWMGYLMVAAGLAVAFLVPQFLARRWRSPRE